jgi:hypothetical protein
MFNKKNVFKLVVFVLAVAFSLALDWRTLSTEDAVSGILGAVVTFVGQVSLFHIACRLVKEPKESYIAMFSWSWFLNVILFASFGASLGLISHTEITMYHWGINLVGTVPLCLVIVALIYRFEQLVIPKLRL